jgi:ATP-dependent Lon protease
VGTIANIVQSLKLPDGNIKVLVEGVERGKILKMSSEEEGYFRVNVQTKQFRPVTTPSLEQLVQRATPLFEQYVKLSQSLNYETMIAAVKVDEIGKLTTPSPPI